MVTPGVSSETAVHGGQVFALARRLGCRPEELLDFSASINPLGVPESVRQAILASLPRVVHYPELHAQQLVEALGATQQIDCRLLMAGAGATEFLFLAPRVLRPRRALIVAPAFGEYAVALALEGVPFDYHRLSPGDDFTLEPDRLLHDLAPDTDLVVLANPANPTGIGYPRGELLALRQALPDGVVLLVDEAFVDFCPEQSLLDQVPLYPNLLLVRSLTKFYAIPGLRVGYLAGSAALIDRFRAQQEPWRLSVPAIAAGMACLADEAYRQETLEVLPVWRQQLAEALEEAGCRVSASVANYLHCRLPGHGPHAALLAERLLPHRLLVRPCEDFEGLGPHDLRVAVRRPDENQRLVSALEAILSAEGCHG